MNKDRQRNSHRALKTVWITGGLTAAVVAMTMMSAGASPPAGDEVDRAAEIAERAAATESSVRTLRLEQGSDAAEASGRDIGNATRHAASELEPVEFPAVPDDWVNAGLDLDEAERTDDGRLVQRLPDDSKVTLTIDPDLQGYLESVLNQHPIPHGSLILIDPPTGRVLAKADRSTRDSQYTNLATNSGPPSASVFKVITAAALMEEADRGPGQEVCYHGGTRGLTERNIVGHPDLDNRCDNLRGALANSINSLIAKETYHHLSRQDLLNWAERFGYNQPIPFELPVEPSTAEFSDDPYEVARAAAGFWHTHMSPLHGAMIGAALANDGVMMEPTVIDRYESPDGEVLYESEPQVFREVMEPETARQLADMMTDTARTGTARNYFAHQPRFPNNIEVSGKTGTLSDSDPFLRFTWFVGFAQHSQWDDHPGVAISGLMANDPAWYMLGPQAASMGLRHFFNTEEQRRLNSPDETVVTR